MLIWTLAFLLPLAPVLSAEKPPAAPETPTLEKVVEEMQKGADAILNKAKELLAAIDAEASAKRIPEGVAQGLRWSLRNLTSLGTKDPRTALATVSMPADDQAIMNAANAYQDTANTVRTEEAELARRAEKVAKKRCVELVGNATKASEVETVEELLERLKSMNSRQQSYSLINGVDQCLNGMRYLRESFDVTSSSDPAKVNRVLTNLNSLQNNLGVDLGSDIFEKRAAIITAPFTKALEDAQNDLETALVEGKPSERVYAALAAYEKAHSGLSVINSFRFQPTNNSAADLNVYRQLASIGSAMQAHHWRRAQTDIGGARQTESALQTLAGRRPAIRGLLEKWTVEIAEGEGHEVGQFRERFHQELGAVKQASDLAAIANELGKNGRDLEGGGNDQYVQQLTMRLSALAAIWKSEDLSQLANGGFISGGPEDVSFHDDLTSLRERIERDILSKTLNAPELTQAPLESQPLAKAIDTLLAKLSAAGEWRRALQIMEAQSMLAPMRGAAPRRLEAITVVRSYLAGQNFELAELWTDAAAAYKAVLAEGTATDGIPIHEAADRLKVLMKAHPEEVKAAQPSPSRGVPPIYPTLLQ